MALGKHHQDHNPCPNPSTDSKFQRRTVQIVVSVSILSGMLLLLFSPLLVHLCFRSLGSFHFPAYLAELQSLIHTPGKNYMFLLCNGILVIIVGCSGLIETGRSGVAPSGPQTVCNDPRFSGQGRDTSNGLTERRRRRTDAEENLPTAAKAEFSIQTDGIQGGGSEMAIALARHHGDDDEIEDEMSRVECPITEQAMQEQPSELRMIIDRAVIDDEGNDDGNDGEAQGELSVEELNRKCDEFIKKMKGEL